MKNLYLLKLMQSFARPAMFVKSGGLELMLLISMLLNFSSQQLSAQNAGFNSSFPVFSVNGSDASYCMFSNTTCGANGALDGANLGTFIRGANTLRLRGAEHNVWKCGSADILGTFINYRVYPSGSPSGSFNERSIDFISGDGSFSNNNGCGGADQRWRDLQENIDLLGSLPSGNYTIEIYSRITTNLSFPGDRYLNNNNNSNNYRAYFTIADAGFNSSFAVFGINGTNSSYCMLNNTTCGTNGSLNGASLGSFVQNSGSLILKGAEHNVFKCFTANITATALNYRVYSAGNASGSYTRVGIDFITGDGSFSNSNGCGGADQRWRDVQENINLTTLTPGNYTIEVYSELTTNGGARFLSNSGANYKASFTISPAPVDCVVGAWGEWSAWSTEACGAEATRTRTRVVVTPASNGGTACPVLEETETRINAQTTEQVSATACDAYTWALNGQTYTNSGQYAFTIGCNTTLLNLTINRSTVIVSANAPIGVIYRAIEARWKGFNNTSGVNSALYLGNNNMGSGGINRVETGRNGLYIKPGETNVSFSYNKASNSLIATVGSRTVTYTSVSTKATGNMNILNFMHIFLRSGSGTNTGVAEFKDVVLNGQSLGSFVATAAASRDWTISNVDFSQGFTLTGKIKLDAGTYGSNESSKLDIWVGNNNSALPCVNESFITSVSQSPEQISLPSLKSAKNESESLATDLEVKLYNNPAIGSSPFRIQILSNDLVHPINVRIIDASGKPQETRQNLTHGSTIEFGRNYNKGLYIVEAVQSGRRTIAKVLKQ